MNRIFPILLFLLPLTASLKADPVDGGGHKIKVKLDNYPQDTLILGFYYGEKPFVKDTFTIGKDGYFTIEADTLLPCGVYLLVLQPDNSFLQFLMPEQHQQFTITTDAKDSVEKMKFKGSDDNNRFYDYLRYLNKRRAEADTLKARQETAKGNPADSIRYAEQLTEIDRQVKQFQSDVVAKNPGSMTARIIKASMEPEVPQMEGDERTVQMKKYYWFREHYFDNIDLSDGCMLRTPLLFSKMEFYINKLTPQHPDSIKIALDQVIKKTEKAPETYKYYLIHFLNYFAKSTFVGMDACYVHLANNYYCNGKAPWVDKEQLEKICDNASRLEPILIGKKAPNITVKDRNDQPVTLYDVDADYTILFFWDPECGHCKKAAPHLVEYAKAIQGSNIKIFAVCTAITDKAKECWKSAEEKEFSDHLMLNTYDPYLQSRFKTLYDVRTTPQLFVLNREKEIVMKRIGAEQLPKVMEQLIEFEKQKKNK